MSPNDAQMTTASNSATSPELSHVSGDSEKVDPQTQKDIDAEFDAAHPRLSAILPVVAPCSPEPVLPSRWSRNSINSWLQEDVDTDAATGPLAAFCFMTGYVDAVSFTACFIWCAFQTGNTVQLSLALARLFSGPQSGSTFLMPDRQALTSVCAFLGGSFLGRIGDRYGAKARGWLVFGTLLQAGLTLAAALCALYANQSGVSDSRADPSWTDTLGFLALAFASASMGLQALLGTRIGAHFATTVVLTSIWVQVISDPVLFRVKRVYKQREYKFLAIFSLFCGGFVGRALTVTIGPAGALGIGSGLRLFISLSWLAVTKKAPKV